LKWGADVAIQKLSESILLVALSEQPQQGDELEEVTRILSENAERDVVVDFAQVRMLTSETLCNLMILERLLRESGRLLVLCNVSAEVKHVFVRTGLVTVFGFAEDESAALQQLSSGARLSA
jgi:anti-anti-sigma regulatory factor